MTDASLAAAANFDERQRLDDRERQIAVLGSAKQISHVIYAVSELAVADLLAERPRTVPELAAETGTHTDALRRVLRGAASVGIFEERDGDVFALTPLGEGLRSDRIGGLRPMVQFSNTDLTRLPYAEILHSVRTGEPAFDRVYGMPFYDYLAGHPEHNRFFEGFMAHWSRRLADRFAGELAPERFRRIADVGGGNGYFLSRMLQRHPAGEGHLFDLPEVVADAEPVLKEAGVADRVTVTGGDFFADELPRGCDAYILKSIIHNWPDERCLALLRRLRETIGDSGATLIAIDQVVPPLNQWDHSKIIDIDMLVLFGGKERTLREWTDLFAAAGFTLVNTPAERGWALLEARVAA
ncbi:methyltransferase [Catenuloplanes atrovinosus]|uniref:Multifunctional cyclase/dehydratase/O-methyltransferase n=1 Tax=Catenuloplanes atrovinosus TaxID=137266 RepID=A0AAE4CBD9_9ACTN|nr:methyltransferase [Catenuloplanes atrovinosus]MDR7276794.1 multifunctional cyclase/dehydratase/O-methyltransferase [Catenuloplanes atrovinosus]